MSSLSSTPQRKSTSSTPSHDSSTKPASQSSLMDDMSSELGGQTWEFPAERLAKALSAKTRKKLAPLFTEHTIDELDNYFIAIDNLQVKIKKAQDHFVKQGFSAGLVRPENSTERNHYPGLVDFLNGGLASCIVGLGQDARRAIHRSLKFHVWDKQMKDGIGGAHPLKPDIAGVLGEETTETLFWSPPVEGESEMIIPVEVKEVWSTLVLQAGTYARCMFSASPLRQFALVIGYDHRTRLLRFLVYHRAGLTASQPLKLDSIEGQKHFVLVLFSILTWKTRAGAGFPAWCNEAQVYLPRSDAAVDIVRILHNSSCVRGRAPRVYYVHVPVASHPKPTEDLTPDTQTKGLRRSLRIQQKSDSQRGKKISGTDGKRSSRQSNRVAELQGKKTSQGSGRNDQRRSDPSKGVSKNSQAKVPRSDNERGRFPSNLCILVLTRFLSLVHCNLAKSSFEKRTALGGTRDPSGSGEST